MTGGGGGGSQCLSFGEWGEGGGEPVFIVRGVGRGRSEDFDRVATKLT